MKTDRLLLWFIFAIASAGLVLAFGSTKSAASLTFNGPSSASIPSFDLSKLNLPQPLVDFINNIRRGTSNASPAAQIPFSSRQNAYPDAVTGWFDRFFRSIPVLSQIYGIVVQVIRIVANFFIEILQFLINLITKGLSFL
jgi:hypothetical protein